VNFLSGWKTRMVGIGAILYGVTLYVAGEPDEAIRMVVMGLGFITLRQGIKTDSGK
jgi:hypothetical protein